MSALAKLKLIASKRTAAANPVQNRRNKLVAKITEQIALATARQEGRTYTATKVRAVTDSATGERKLVEVAKRIKEWFWINESGKTVVSIRYGAKTLEFAKGKNAVEVASTDDLISTLLVIKEAVIAGELDDAITNASERLRAGFAR
jgi:hypothetical protein